MFRRQGPACWVVLVVSLVVLAGCLAPLAAASGTFEDEGDGLADGERGIESARHVASTLESTGAESAGGTTAQSLERQETAPSDPPIATHATGETDEKPESEPAESATAGADERLPVDVDETFDRVATLLESDAEMPAVAVRTLDERLEERYAAGQDPFQHALNMTETEVDTENARGMTTPGLVVVDPNDGTDADVEQVLVHEFVHAVQFAETWLPDPALDADVATSTDYRTVETALIEGGAVWATDQYTAIHQGDVVRQSERLAAEYETAPDGDRYFRAPYHYGYQYAAERLEEPAELGYLAENPPTTTEHLLHGLDPDEAQPTDLVVDVADTAAAVSLERNDRLGELFVRVALETELDGAVAAEAATGWGNDRLLEFEDDDGERGFVWVLHWDSPDDADAFEEAFGSVLEERTDERAAETVVDREGAETVVVTVGSESFREGTTVTGSGTDLNVSVGEEGT